MISVAEVELFYQPEGRLRLATADRCFLSVRPAWAAPLSKPDEFLALLDGKGKEILMVRHINDLPEAAQEVVRKELAVRYLNSTVRQVLSAKTEFGVTYWHVLTDRGEKEFVTQSLQENAQWLDADFLLLIDTDGNRFELKNISQMDEKSRRVIEATV